MISLRPYQSAAVDAAVGYLRAGRHPLIVQATGTGKTRVIARFVELARGRVVVVVHRRELVVQAADTIEELLGRRPAIEMGDDRAPPGAWCVVASRDSLARRLDAYPPGSVSLVVVDEAHHAAAASYRKTFAHLGCLRVGVTATPGARPQTLGFDGVAFSYGIREGIADGVLVRPLAVQVDARVDWSQLRVSGRDYTDASAEAAIAPALGEWCRAVVELAGDRPGVMFLPTVASAYAAAETLRALGMTAAAADGSTPTAEREQILRDYAEGRLQCVVNCALWTEGWDAPHTSFVAVGRPTRNSGFYAQMVGRGLRLSPGKTDCLVIDLAASGDHCDLVLASLADEMGAPPAAREAARGKPGVVVDVMAVVERVEMEARAAEIERVRQIDILRGERRRAPCSPKQAAVLRRMGINPEGMTLGQAGAVIGRRKA